MKLIRSLIILAVVLILGAATYWLVYKPDRLAEIRRAQEKFLVQFDVSTINRFALGRPDTTIVIEKGIGNLWHITDPVASEAEHDEIRTLFENLRTAEILYIVEDDADNLETFGLAENAVYLATQYVDGDTDTLYTGINTPDGSMTYAKLASDDRVLTIGREIADHLKQPLRAYQARTMLNVYSTDITGVELIRDDDDVVTLTSNGFVWRMTRPWDLPADANNVDSIINTIAETQKKHYVADSAEDLAQYGLDDPSLIVRVMLSKGMPDKLLLIGDKLSESGGGQVYTYAKQFDQDGIFTIQNIPLADLTRAPSWYIEKHLITFDRSRVNRIVVETGGSEFTLVRSGQDYWSVVEPRDINVENTLINDIFGISRFATIRTVFAFEPDEQAIVEAGLDQPQARITFYQNDIILEHMEYGDTYTDDMPNTYFRASARPSIFITRAEVTETLNKLIDMVFND